MDNKQFNERAAIAVDDCGLGQIAQVLSDKWMLLIIREAFYGVGRFEDIRADINIPKAVLSGRLKTLVELGVLEKLPYQLPGERQRFGYVLTAAGKALFPLIVAATQWGDKFLRQGKPSFQLIHRQTGKPIEQAFCCEDKKIAPSDIAVQLMNGESL